MVNMHKNNAQKLTNSSKIRIEFLGENVIIYIYHNKQTFFHFPSLVLYKETKNRQHWLSVFCLSTTRNMKKNSVSLRKRKKKTYNLK